MGGSGKIDLPQGLIRQLIWTALGRILIAARCGESMRIRAINQPDSGSESMKSRLLTQAVLYRSLKI
jgi:hypothetical protein